MAPLPVPEPFNPIAPIQNNWDKISPYNKGYLAILGGIGTVFGFATAISLIVEHQGKPPKWPFTRDRWNPKPTIDGDKKEEVSEEQIVDDELAEVVGVLDKRSLLEEDVLEWYPIEFVDDTTPHLFKRDGLSILGPSTEKTDEIPEEWKEIVEAAKKAAPYKVKEPGPLEKLGGKIGAELADFVNTAEDVGKEMLDDLVGIFDLSSKEETDTKPASSGNKKEKAG